MAASRLPIYAPLEIQSYDPFGPLAGYAPGVSPWGEPVRSRLRDSIYPILELCIDAYYVSISKTFHGQIEFEHHLEQIRHFLREGADVEVTDYTTGGTCLHFAAGAGAIEVCKLLLRARARSTVRDRRLRTPLWWAMKGSHATVCQLLLRSDGTIATTGSIDRLSPLHEAASLGSEEIVELLLPFYARHGPDIVGHELRTPLHLAARHGCDAACRLLVDWRADPQRTCSHGKTALHYAVEGGIKSIELCAYLIRCRPATRSLRDASGQTPLQLAARHGCLTLELQQVLEPLHSARPARHRPRSASAGHRRRATRGGVGRSVPLLRPRSAIAF